MNGRSIPRLHLIGPSPGLGMETYLDIAAAAAAGGASAIHVRMPGALASDVLDLASRLRARIGSASLVINDRIDVALICDADAVQLGERSIPVRDARRLLGRDMFIGRSIHDVDGAVAAERDGADYLIAGHIFATDSKPGLPPRGVAWLRQITSAVSIPVIAIGGVTHDRVASLLDAGAWGIAVSSAIRASDSPSEAARSFVEEMHFQQGGARRDNYN